MDECAADAAVGSGNQDRLIRDVHFTLRGFRGQTHPTGPEQFVRPAPAK